MRVVLGSHIAGTLNTDCLHEAYRVTPCAYHETVMCQRHFWTDVSQGRQLGKRILEDFVVKDRRQLYKAEGLAKGWRGQRGKNGTNGKQAGI